MPIRQITDCLKKYLGKFLILILKILSHILETTHPLSILNISPTFWYYSPPSTRNWVIAKSYNLFLLNFEFLLNSKNIWNSIHDLLNILDDETTQPKIVYSLSSHEPIRKWRSLKIDNQKIDCRPYQISSSPSLFM